MDCKNVQAMIENYLDKELALSDMRSIEQHIEQCENCRRKQDTLMVISKAVAKQGKFTAPATLRNKVRKNLKELSGESDKRFDLVSWLGFSGGVAAMASVATWAVLSFTFYAPVVSMLLDDIVDAHVRSMMVDHVIDIKSSDRHTVKPWFNGKLDFAPLVKDFSNENYELVGGRLDYLQQRAVSAIVYRRREHIINVFMWPASQSDSQNDSQEKSAQINSHSQQGYNLVNWHRDGLTYWLVSDLNKKELNELADLLGFGSEVTL